MSGRTGHEAIDISPGAGRSGIGADINPRRGGWFVGFQRAAELIVLVIVALARASGITHSRGFR